MLWLDIKDSRIVLVSKLNLLFAIVINTMMEKGGIKATL